MRGSTRRNTAKQPFPLCKEAARRIGFLIRHGNDAVDETPIEVFRNEVCTDALQVVLSGIPAAEQRGGRRLDGHDLNRRVPFFEIPCRSAQRSAGSNTRHKRVDLSVCVAPQLRPGRIFMCGGICGVVKLACDPAARDLGLQLLRAAQEKGYAVRTRAGQKRTGRLTPFRPSAAENRRVRQEKQGGARKTPRKG